MSQHEIRPIPSVRRIAAKEITLFFASPIAYLFLATFAGVALFVFFWGEAFFARNIADVRPLFEWCPGPARALFFGRRHESALVLQCPIPG